MVLVRYSFSLDFSSGRDDSWRMWTLGESVEHCDEKSIDAVSLETYKVYFMSVTFAFVGLLCCRGWYYTEISLNLEE
jgi:hypothetical protein